MATEAELVEVLTGRQGDEARAKDLASACLAGMAAYAMERTIGQGGVPTTLVGTRVELLLHISMLADEAGIPSPSLVGDNVTIGYQSQAATS
jgi:hypothetical protein